MDSVIRDLRYAMRSIAGSKRFAAIVIATLALGIGVNTAVFGVLNAVVLKPLPYDEPERLVRVYQSSRGEDNYLPGLAVLAFRERSKTLDVAAVYTYSAQGADLTDRAEPERVRAMPVSADYFRVLRVHPILGQVFDQADERRDARVAIVSEWIWRKYLGGAPDAAGRVLSLNGVPFRVAAVLPDGFDDPLESGVDVWMPVNLQPGGTNSWDNQYLTVRPSRELFNLDIGKDTSYVCARQYAERSIRSCRIIQMHTQRDHSLEGPRRSMRVEDASFHGPRPPLSRDDTMTQREGRVLMPRDEPIGSRRLIEQRGSEGHCCRTYEPLGDTQKS